jgi:pteridine reductase
VQKNVLITGAAKRVGAACARTLHAEGCNIIVHYRNSAAAAQSLFAELEAKRNNSVRIIKADLLQMNELEMLTEEAVAAWGGLDVLVNNASAFYPTKVSSLTEAHWDELLGSNLKAPFFLVKAVSTALAARQGGVVNIVDIHAEKGLQGYPVYSIAKAGLAAMTKILAKELAPDIRVNAVAPGAILWPENDQPEDEKQEILRRIALQRLGQPDDIAKAIWFLINDAEYVTGQIINVDGGRTLNY